MENKQPKSNQVTSSVFSRISAWLFSSLKNGIFGHFFTSYDRDNEKFRSIAKKRQHSGEKRTKRTIARALEKNVLVNIIPKIQGFLLRVSMRDYGIVLFTMALLTCGIFFIQDYVNIIYSPLSSLVVGIVVGVISLPMMLSKRTIASFLLDSSLTNLILFRFLGFSEDSYSEAIDEGAHSSPSISLIAGFVLAIISYFLGPLWTFALIGILFLAYQVLITPEAGVLIFILTAPFTSSLVMSIIGVYVAICYLVKCIVGRRTFKFEFLDLWMVILMAVCTLGGFISFDMPSSTKDMALTLCILTSFFVVSNLVRSKEWYRRCIVAICICCTISSLIGIIQFVLGKLEITWSGMSAFATIHDRVNSTFADPDSFALFIVACLPFLLLFVLSGKGAPARVIGLICSAIAITALILTYSKVGFIGVFALLVLMLIIFHRNTIYAVLLVVATCLVLAYALPEHAIESIKAIVALPTNTHAYRLMLFDASIEMILQRPFGVGLGDSAFSLAHGALVGGEPIANSGNTYLQLAISCGIIGLILFICAIVVFFKLCLTYCAKTQKKARRINALAGFCSVFGLLVSGFYGFIWSDKTILVVFILCASLTFAYIRIERDEASAPRMISVDVLTASIDIELEKNNSRDFIPKRKYVRTPKKKKKRSSDTESLGIKVNEIDPVIRRD